ncbi:hypothetical protein [Promicromonospora panici]|uniref:hypothetical protein n=1 Tax=Promicromonospora panici TaxID=2219658 RepID=UPI00101D1EEE|nr:hypothetical protein [Promicromonospora panici]
MSGATHRDTQEIDRVLGALTGHDLFRRNAFRVTGLPTDATERQVRRAREDSRSQYYVPPSVGPDVPLPPSEDPDELRAAFEVLRDPVARLVHELLWARFVDGRLPDVQLRAVSELCLALEGTSPDGVVRDAAARRRWDHCLDLWAAVLAAESTWELARRRAAELDDPRLTTATVDALRERLPEHVVGVVAGLAARRAVEAPDDARRWRDLARAAGFETGDVRRAFRSAAQPDLDAVEAACEVARAASSENVGIDAAETLLAVARQHLESLSGLLGADDDLVVGCHDDVALAMNNCVVRFVNADTGDYDAVGVLLREAYDLARSPASREQIGANLDASGHTRAPAREIPEAVAWLGCLGILVVIGLLIWAGFAFSTGVLGIGMPDLIFAGIFFSLVFAGAAGVFVSAIAGIVNFFMDL